MSTEFGTLLKHWRQTRRYSQLALANQAGLSARHISFLETGRAKAGRHAVLTLARTLDMPKAVTNQAMLTAGFAPHYPALDLSDIDLAPMNAAMLTMLDNHSPMPAIIIDGSWKIVGGNAAAMHMVKFLPMGGSLNVVDALLGDDPENPIFLNWDVLASWTLTRLQIESSRVGPSSDLRRIYEALARDPRCEGILNAPISCTGPYLTMQARIDGQVLSLFTMLAEFTSAQDVTMSERRVELFFAADEVTKAYFDALGLG